MGKRKEEGENEKGEKGRGKWKKNVERERPGKRREVG